MQLLSLIPILILLLYLLVSIDLVYTRLCELVPEEEQLYSKLNSNCSGAETANQFWFRSGSTPPGFTEF